MGLQVWLPLNGNLNQQGLANVAVSNNGATVNTAGKIGSCYSFSGNSLYGDWSEINTLTQISGCCWVYLNNLSSAQYFFHLGGQSSYPCKFSLDYEGSIRFQINGTEYISGITLTTGIWYHLAITWNGTMAKLYVNGIESYSKSATGSFSASNHFAIGARTNGTAGNTFAYAITNGGKLNDIRLYDHALSPREVKEISKGLVLHYPLAMPGQENLIKNSSLFQTTDYWVNNQNVVCSVENGELKAVINQSDSTPGIRYTESLSSLQSGEYIATVIAKVENGNKDYISYPFYIANVSTGGYQRESIGNGYYKYTKTFSVSSAIQVSLYIITSGSKVGETWYIKSVKLERGSHPTPWIPNPADAKYSTLGFDDGIEYDVSGYERNGIKNNITNSSDTPRYNTSSVFNGSSGYISLSHSDFNPLLNGGTTPFTIAFWIYHADSTRGIIFGDYSLGGNNTNIELTTGHSIRFYWNGSPDMIFDGAVSLATWAHVALVYNGTNIYFYKNGILEDSRTVSLSTKSKVNGEYRIGRDVRSDYTMFNGKLSDFRVYSTALSADDILELYHTPISLSHNGALLTQGEYVES